MLKWEVGDGNTISLWYDPWHPWGPLVNWLGERTSLQVGWPKETRLCSFINGSNWEWPLGAVWNRINSSLGGLKPNSSQPDRLVWLNCSSKDLSIKMAYSLAREPSPKVDWYSTVWNKTIYPRHAFILWLIVQERLYTMDKLVSWGIINSNCCYLCNIEEENHDHIFMTCAFSKEVWRGVELQLNWSRNRPSMATSFYALLADFGSLSGALFKKALAVVCYYIWRERNVRRSGGKASSPKGLLRIICSCLL